MVYISDLLNVVSVIFVVLSLLGNVVIIIVLFKIDLYDICMIELLEIICEKVD